MITKPQVDFLTQAMREAVPAAGASVVTANVLTKRGYATPVGVHSSMVLYAPTLMGLKALREYRAKRWANYGCVAYLQQLQEVEDALKATKP